MIAPTTPPSHEIPLREAFRVWLRVAALSFGGPAGQIAVMHRILVEEKRWISDARFLHALNYCMLLPGPEAQRLATYIGWLMHRTLGGVMAGGLGLLGGRAGLSAFAGGAGHGGGARPRRRVGRVWLASWNAGDACGLRGGGRAAAAFRPRRRGALRGRDEP